MGVAKHLVPGSGLPPLRQDDRLPLMLIQRSLESPLDSNKNASVQSESRSIHGWTLIAPKGWGMPLLSSLTHTGTRVGGQRERESQRREAGCAYYPRDSVGTRGYDSWAEERGKDEKKKWERKPPAKRACWENVGTSDPWQADWGSVLGIKKGEKKAVWGEMDFEMGGLMSTQREDETAMIVDSGEDVNGGAEEDSNAVHPLWLLRGPETVSIIASLTVSHAASSSLPSRATLLHTKITSLRQKIASTVTIRREAFTGELDSCINEQYLYQRALVMVRLRVPRSGSPEDLAIVYAMEDDEAMKWRDVVEECAGRTGKGDEVRSSMSS